MRKTVVFGFLGTKLDGGVTEKRWARWRPSVALCSHETFPVSRLELLLCRESHAALAEQVTADIAVVSPGTVVTAHQLDLPDPWDFTAVYERLHAFAAAYPYEPDTDYYVHLTTGTHTSQICLFLLTEARYFPARLVDTSYRGNGADPKGLLDVIDLDLSAYSQLTSRFAAESASSQGVLKSGIETRNAEFNSLIERIERVCLRSAAPMLLTGPTGAGKSQLAKRIYALRKHRHLVQGPLVEVNCATLRGDNAMSTLFGHKKGAFTGAQADRPGLLKAADGGLLFLDEIGELGDVEQTMLLKALEEKVFLPLGSDKEVKSDFQLIAGTNRNLAEEVAAGRFRADLYARINLWTFELPGLARRREDIEPNLEYELRRVSAERNQRIAFSPAARAAYLAFAAAAPWPGNFRDLASSVTRMATLAHRGCIEEGDVELEIEMLRSQWGPQGECASGGLPAVAPWVDELLGALALDDFDRFQLERVLPVVAASASLAEAGRRLFAVSRVARATTNDSDRLRKYLERFGLDYQTIRGRV